MFKALLDQSFWNGKKVLITGHTGFKGMWLSFWLKSLKAQVYGISLPPLTNPNLYDLASNGLFKKSLKIDIRNYDSFYSECSKINPEIIFHLAAQPLVRESYKSPLNTFSSNLMGTVNVLETIRNLSSIQSAVLITTDKVYKENLNKVPYREDDMLGGHDPYSASKAACEIAIDSYRKSFLDQDKIPIASARAGNVIGGGDWSEDRLIPDAIKAWSSEKPLIIRNPDAIRPWQHVLEPLYGYMVLAQEISLDSTKSGSYNFGPSSSSNASVKEVISLANQFYEGGETKFKSSKENPRESDWLMLDINKSKKELNISPKWNLVDTVEQTINWYKDFIDGTDPYQISYSQIELYDK